jgi:hypothetical protein
MLRPSMSGPSPFSDDWAVPPTRNSRVSVS